MRKATAALTVGAVILIVLAIWQSQPVDGPRFEIIDFYGDEDPDGSAWWWGGDCYKITFKVKNVGSRDATEVRGTAMVRDFARAKYASGFRDKASQTQTWRLPQGCVLEPGESSQPIVVLFDENPTLFDSSVSLTIECSELVSQQFVEHLQP